MITAFRDPALRGVVTCQAAGAVRRASGVSIVGAIVLGLVVAGSHFALRTAHAEDAFGSAIGNDELSVIRGGDNDTNTNSQNTTAVAGSEQNTNATNNNNPIGGDAVAGSFTVGAGAISSNRGMTNVVVNTAPQSNTQGVMTLNLVLQ